MNRNITKSLIVISLSLLGFKGTGQEKSPIYVKYGLSTLKDVDSGHISHLEGQLVFPILKEKGVGLATGIAPQALLLENLPMEIGTRLFELGIPIVAKLKGNGRNEYFLAGKISLNSDLENITIRDIIFGMGVGMQRKFSDDLTLGIGLGYAHQFFGNQLIPLLDFDYRITHKLSIYGRFPMQGTLAYSSSIKSTLGLEWNLNASSYGIGKETDEGSFVRVRNLNGGLFYSYQLLEHWKVKITGGMGAQKFESFQNKQTGTWTIITIPLSDREEPLETYTNRAMQFQIGLLYAF
ncbi:DUF6268 family outer membrane beta-barrel protein [Allomuricauda sp. M10]|uniref:DUF6268 family outer membrane beta-barrel protein n=1 Tax=Allomuricauda sp. M10 TaxID=2683292 RepID=UPI001D182F2C|nr:DUF6268 family outer membrane beta-barrel protein [Muricauda sp. M10]